MKMLFSTVLLVCCMMVSNATCADIDFNPIKEIEPKPSEEMKNFDYAAAATKLRELADKGDLSAKVELGYLYYEGKGVTKDPAQAAQLFRQAAEKGNANAQSNLGKMYQTGVGVKKDSAEAVKWFKLAAEQGHADAQASLGLAYTLGEGVTRNKVEGLKWVLLASEQKHKLAGLVRNQMIREVTKEEALEADRLAKEWKPKKPGK